MNNKQLSYEPARVCRIIQLEMEGDILAASVVDKIGVEAAGQETHEMNFGFDNTDEFNFHWEE